MKLKQLAEFFPKAVLAAFLAVVAISVVVYFSSLGPIGQANNSIIASVFSSPVPLDLLPVPGGFDVQQFPPNADVERIVLEIRGQAYNVSPLLAGSNLGVWVLNKMNTSAIVSLVRAVRPGIIRFPGGEIGDGLRWTRDNYRQWYEAPGMPGYLTGWLTPKDIDAAVAFARSVNAELVMQVNARLGDATLAADMVRYANVEKRYGIRYWEIGNEPELWDLKHPLDENESTDVLSPEFYAKTVGRYAKEMRKVDPAIKIVTPGCFFAEACEKWGAAITAEQDAYDGIDLFSVHKYALDNSTLLDGYVYHVSDNRGGELNSGAITSLNFGWNPLTIPLPTKLSEAHKIGISLTSTYYTSPDYVVLGDFVLKSKSGEVGIPLLGKARAALVGSVYVLDGAFRNTGNYTVLNRGWQVVSASIPDNAVQPLYQAGLSLIYTGGTGNIFVRRVFLSGARGEKIISDFTREPRALPFIVRAYSSGEVFAKNDSRLFYGWNRVSVPVSGSTNGIGFQLISKVFEGHGVFLLRNPVLVGQGGLRKPLSIENFVPVDGAYRVKAVNRTLRIEFMSKSPKGTDAFATLHKQVLDDLGNYSMVEADIKLESDVTDSFDGFGSPNANISIGIIDGQKVIKVPVVNHSSEFLALLAENTVGYDAINFEIYSPENSAEPIVSELGSTVFVYDFNVIGKKVAYFYLVNEADWTGFDELEARVFIPHTVSSRDHILTSKPDFSQLLSSVNSVIPNKSIAMTEFGPYNVLGFKTNVNQVAGAIWALKFIDELARTGISLALSFDLVDSIGFEAISLNGTPNKRYFAFLFNAMSESLRIPVAKPVDQAVFASARVSENRSLATFILVNEHRDQSKKFELSLTNKTIRSSAAWLLDDEHNATLVDAPRFSGGDAFVELPPYSAVLVRLELA